MNLLPRLSAIICTYNRYKVLPDAINSLRTQKLDDGFIEIIIVDNSANQEAAHAFSMAYQNIPNLHYICEPQTGLSNARNVGLAAAKADFAGFIDDDAIASPGWAQAMIDTFANFRPRHGAKIGVIGGPSRPVWQAKRPQWLGDDLLPFLALTDRGKSAFEMADRGIFGCNMVFNKKLILELGGFCCKLGRSGPETTLISNEEPEIFKKIANAGWAFVYTPDAAVAHIIDPSRLTQDWFRRRAAWQAVSDYMMDPKQFAASTSASRAHLCARMGHSGWVKQTDGEIDDPIAFSDAYWAIYYAVLIALAGGALPLAPLPGWRVGWWNPVMRGRIFALTQKQPHIAWVARAGLRGYQRLTGR